MGSKEGMRFSVTMMESHGHWSVELRDGAERKQNEMILRRSVMVEYCKMEKYNTQLYLQVGGGRGRIPVTVTKLRY